MVAALKGKDQVMKQDREEVTLEGRHGSDLFTMERARGFDTVVVNLVPAAKEGPGRSKGRQVSRRGVKVSENK